MEPHHLIAQQDLLGPATTGQKKKVLPNLGFEDGL